MRIMGRRKEKVLLTLLSVAEAEGFTPSPDAELGVKALQAGRFPASEDMGSSLGMQWSSLSIELTIWYQAWAKRTGDRYLLSSRQSDVLYRLSIPGEGHYQPLDPESPLPKEDRDAYAGREGLARYIEMLKKKEKDRKAELVAMYLEMLAEEEKRQDRGPQL